MLESFTIKNPRNLGSTKQATAVWLIKRISDSRKMIEKYCTMDHCNLDCLLSTDVGNHGYGDSLWCDAKYGISELNSDYFQSTDVRNHPVKEIHVSNILVITITCSVLSPQA